MKHILALRNEAFLQRLTNRKVLLAFDFDGTLAPIVSDRNAAFMPRRTLRLFERLCKLYPCAIITGRQKADVIDRLGDARVQHIVGNHGLEMGISLSSFRGEMKRVRSQLERLLRDVEGVDVEDKRVSLSLHFNHAPHKKETFRQMNHALSCLTVPVRIVHGKNVINVVSRKAPHKGHALAHLYRLEKSEGALYVGDDTTDEDVFRMRGLRNLLCVRVGRSKTSGASFFLSRQNEIDPLLERLIEFR